MNVRGVTSEKGNDPRSSINIPSGRKKKLKKFRLDRESSPDLCDDRTQPLWLYIQLRGSFPLSYLYFHFKIRVISYISIQEVFTITTFSSDARRKDCKSNEKEPIHEMFTVFRV